MNNKTVIEASHKFIIRQMTYARVPIEENLRMALGCKKTLEEALIRLENLADSGNFTISKEKLRNLIRRFAEDGAELEEVIDDHFASLGLYGIGFDKNDIRREDDDDEV